MAFAQNKITFEVQCIKFLCYVCFAA